MNKTEKIDVRYVADLARIELTEDEIARYSQQLEEILEYARQLSKFDVSGIEPTAHATPRANILRDDEPRPSMERGLLLANAPIVHTDTVSIQVPAMIEEQY